MTFVKGDIVLPIDRVKRKNWLKGLYHPAVVWDEFLDEGFDFCGIMLTNSPPNGQFDNILMSEDHFEAGHKVGYSNTQHFVNQTFIKFANWGPFELVGRLTPDGLVFIESSLDQNSYPLEFIQYRAAVIS